MDSKNSGQKDWHTLSWQKTAEDLGVLPEHGLSVQEARQRQVKYGLNQLETSKEKRWWEILAEQVQDLMILVLFLAALVSAAMGHTSDALVILFIVLVNALVSTYQELKAQKSLKSLRNLNISKVRAMRGGKISILPITDLVPGDVVHLEAGDLVPADIRWMSTQGLSVDESALTGESTPIEKDASVVHEKEIFIGDRLNLGHKGTKLTKGRAHGLVVATGKETEFGKLAKFIQESEQTETPLQHHLQQFTRKLTFILLILCSLVFLEGIWLGGDIKVAFLTAISLAVAAIPESLPAIVTLALSLGAMRLARHKSLVRRLASVEGLGSVSVICTDKTGTLTENRMKVEEIWEAQNANDFPVPLLMAMALNNDSSLKDEFDLLEERGDPTELALKKFSLLKLGKKNYQNQIKQFPRIFEWPFDSQRKLMSTMHQKDHECILICKGAPEAIVQTLANSEEYIKKEIISKSHDWAARGLRVLAFAIKKYPLELDLKKLGLEAVERDLHFLGLVGMIDPPRMEVMEAIRFCKKAKIKIKMITGDHPLTAVAIGKRIGLEVVEKNVVTGKELSSLGSEELLKKIDDFVIMARVSAEQKLRLVNCLQEKGEFVAMTGDGVNDAPALKASDIGVSMGLSGTEVAKDSSDLTLLDDNFATLVEAIKEGRKIYENLKRFLFFVLGGNLGEIITIVLGPLLFGHLPLLPLHILWVNLVTDGVPGLFLALEDSDASSWEKAPEGRKKKILDNKDWVKVLELGMLLSGCTLLGFYLHLPAGIEVARTVAFSILSIGQLLMVLSLRTEDFFWRPLKKKKGMRLLGISLVTAFLQIFLMQTDVGKRWLVLGGIEWLAPGGPILAVIPFLYTELKKLFTLLVKKGEKSA